MSISSTRQHFAHISRAVLDTEKLLLRDRIRQDKDTHQTAQLEMSLGRKLLERVASRVQSRCGSGYALGAP